MKNKNTVKKKIAVILKLVILLVFLYSLIFVVRSGKQEITIRTVSSFSSGSNLNALVDVKSKKTKENLESKLTIELLDHNEKKVKKVKEKYKTNNMPTDISVALPQELESGKYYLKVSAKAGIFKDVLKVPINITKEKKSETIISLDKGIYKPGDEINYRALIISKNDNTPIASNETVINIFDGNDNKVYSETTTTSNFGIVSGKFKLSDTVNSGTYKLVVSTINQSVTKEFIVNPYVTPKFEVSVTTDKEIYMVGEKANITVSAKYFFGEPVKNASIKGLIDDEEFVGLTNENGSFTKEVQVTKEGTCLVTLNVEDSSNYFIEATKSFTGATDIFEIEVLPEYNNLVRGVNNDIYFITKTADNNPVKTYMTVKLGNISREVITDENGIGKISLSASDIQNNISSEKLSIVAENMAGEKVEKNLELKIDGNTGTILKTDKIKYDENENIQVSLESIRDNQNYKNLYIFKGKELIKTITFEEENVEFNLEGISGLIDISTDSNVNYHSNYYDYYFEGKMPNYNHKTIFIKPSKALNINIETDKDTYAPKDNLNIKFDVSNESNKSVDSALLVSILDDAVLNLADNDLSIDNLKLALNDIVLADGISAADLYAMVLDDSNTMQFTSILLKQNIDNQNLIKNDTSHTVINVTAKYVLAMIISAAILIVITFNSFMKKHEKFRKFIFSLNIAIIDIIAMMIVIYACIGDKIYNILYFEEWVSYAVCAVIAIVSYNLILYKQKNYIFNLIYELVLMPGIILLILKIIESKFYFYELTVLVIIAWLLLLCVFSAISRSRKLNKFWTCIKNYVFLIGKAIFFWGAALLVSLMCDSILGFIIVLTIYILYEKYVLKKTDIKVKDGKIIFNITGNELIGAFTGVILILMIIIFISNIRNFSSNVNIEDSMYMNVDTAESNTSGTISFDGMENQANSFVPMGSKELSSSKDNKLDVFENIPTLFDSRGEANESIEDVETENNLKQENKVEDNVRNVFLESLAFVPELVTNNGKADLNLKISDNITTWNIQAVGNSKDGQVGFASSNFKVFKEFFVDFSLPTNTVVTDKVSVPVTVYNYTENSLDVTLKVVENDWSKIGEYPKVVANVPAKSTQMIYVPLEIIKPGNNTLRIESNVGNVSDIVEKQMKVSINGIKKEAVISSGTIDSDLEQDILFKDNAIDQTKKIKIKLYPSAISQVIENMDAILEMPTGCFEQTSSSLYPDVLALEYLKENDLNSPEIEEKALEYISAGYQKLLTYEVKGKKGGYSLYGNSPAEPVITAFGLMEMKDLSNVYQVDENVIENMKEYLFDEQNINGTFNYGSTYIGGASQTDELAMNAYIIWALSEVCPKDTRLEKSIKYLEKKLDSVEDNYTLALIGNVFSNVDNLKTKDVIKRLMDGVQNINNESAYITSNIKGYLGTYGKNQNIQATALTSLLLTKEKSNEKTNAALVNYIIESKDTNGTWYNTQSTILALKAINVYNDKSNATNQNVVVTFNDQKQDINIKENVLDLYELEFTNVDIENKISVSMKKGRIYYEIVKDYYETYEVAKQEQELKSSSKLLVEQSINNQVNVNDIISQKITITNLTKDNISNAIVRINIPQGCTVLEDSLLQLEYERKIEKFEYNYNTVDLYIRNYNVNDVKTLTVNYRAGYPEQITGASISVYDYYNPEVNGICMPVEINVNAK